MKKANVWQNLLDVGGESEKIALIFRIPILGAILSENVIEFLP